MLIILSKRESIKPCFLSVLKYIYIHKKKHERLEMQPFQNLTISAVQFRLWKIWKENLWAIRLGYLLARCTS